MKLRAVKHKAIRVLVIAFAACLLTVLGVAAQSDDAVTVTTTAQIPIVVETGADGTTNPVTVTLVVTKAVTLMAGEIVSSSVGTQLVVPEDAPLAVEQTPEATLEASFEAAAGAPATAAAAEATAATTTALVPKANRGANLRGGPGTNYPVVGGVTTGEELEIVAQNADGSWFKLADGAWIAAFLVNDAPTDLPVAEAPPVPTPAPQPTAAPNVAQDTPATPAQMIEAMTAAIARNPNDGEAYLERGYAYLQQSDYPRALDDLNRAVALLPQEKIAFYVRGVIYHNMNNCSMAIQDYTQAINLGLNTAQVYEGRAVCYLTLENYAMALPDMERLLQLNPNHPQRSEIEALITQIRQSQ